MPKTKERWWLFSIIIVYVLLITLPYIYAWQISGDNHVFTGLLANPMDGNSYLAKMRQGFNGAWSFRLPYSYEPGEGAYINLLYLLMGHIARLLGLPLVITYHIFRIIGAVLLVLSINHLCGLVFDKARDRRLALILTIFGSGLGWLALLFDHINSDIWVVETFPFLSSYISPHFSLGMALQVWLMGAMVQDRRGWADYARLALAALVLAMISPFAMVVTGAVGVGYLALKFVKRRAWQPFFWRLAVMGICSAPLLGYYFWLSKTHPVLQIWNAQNLTASPPWWDLLIALTPALLLALYVLRMEFNSDNGTRQLLAVWLVVCLALVYIPFNLQRRFLHGLYVPVAIMAVLGLIRLAERWPEKRKTMLIVLLVLSMATNVIVLTSTVFGARKLDPAIYLWRDEYQALRWLEQNTAEETLVMASPDTGVFIPVYTDDRVLYGHPFETVHAEEMEALVDGFYKGVIPADMALTPYAVDYVFYGPREKLLGKPEWLNGRTPVYDQGDVQVYAVAP